VLHHIVQSAYKNLDVRNTGDRFLRVFGTKLDVDLFTRTQSMGSRSDAHVSRLLVTKAWSSRFPDAEACSQELAAIAVRCRCVDIKDMFAISENAAGDLLLDVPEVAAAIFVVEKFLHWLDINTSPALDCEP